MSDSEIADTGNVPGVPTNITSTEGIARTNTDPENICTRDIGTQDIDTEGNTSITHTPGVNARGGNLSPEHLVR